MPGSLLTVVATIAAVIAPAPAAPPRPATPACPTAELQEVIDLLEIGTLVDRLDHSSRVGGGPDVQRALLRAELASRVASAALDAERTMAALEDELAVLSHTRAGVAPLTASSRLLAPYFGEPPPPDLYPPLVWRYLAQSARGSLETRRDRLVAEWRQQGRVPDPHGEALPPKSITVLLSEKVLMLSDVRAQVVSLRRSLASLAHARFGRSCQVNGLK